MIKYYAVLICLISFYGCQDNTPVAGPYPVEGSASWYNPLVLASGERYHEYEFSCAMRNSDFGKDYLVCNLENNKCVVAKHNDFGPSLGLFKSGRVIDLSKHAFSKIADLKKGIIKVKIGEVHSGLPIDN